MIGKTQARELQRDYVPGGRGIPEDKLPGLPWRRTMEHEVYQCGRQVDYDPQSGGIYCGDVAEYVAITPDGQAACLCERHTPTEVRGRMS